MILLCSSGAGTGLFGIRLSTVLRIMSWGKMNQKGRKGKGKRKGKWG
jgi:hypothetical protein